MSRSKASALIALGAILLHTVQQARAATTWTAAGNGNWSVDANWNGGAGPVPTSGDTTQITLSASGTMSYSSTNDIGPFMLNSLTFDNTGTGLITLDGNPLTFAGVNPALLSSGSGPVTVTAPLNYAVGMTVTNSGTGSLTLGAQTFASDVTITNSGAGTLTLSDAVTYSGTNVAVNLANTGTGTFNIGNLGSSLSGSLNITTGAVSFAGNTGGDLFGDGLILHVASGASFNFANNGETFGGISGAGNIIMGSAGLTFSAAGNRTYSGSISGAGGVTQNNSGILTLGGANAYSGSTTIQAGGTIKASAANVLSGSSAITIVAGLGTLDTGGFSQTVGGLTGGGPAAQLIVDSGNALTVNGSGTTLRQFNGAVTGAGGLTIGGTAIQSFRGTNTYTGATTLNGGTLRVELASLASTSGITLNGGTLDAIVSNNATWNKSLTGAGGLVKSGTGNLTFNTATGATLTSLTLNGGTVTLDRLIDSNPTFAGTPVLLLANGMLSLVGNSGAATTQDFAATTLRGGATIQVISGNNQSASMALGAIDRSIGSSLNITLANTGSGVASASTTVQNSATGIVGGWATINGTDWLVTGTGAGPFNAAALASGSYSDNIWAAGAHVNMTSNFAPVSAAAPASVRFNTAGASTLTLVGTNSLNTGGLLVSPNVGANATTITGGTLTAAAGSELFVHQFNTPGDLTIASVIGNTANVSSQSGSQTSGNATISGLTSTAGFVPGMLVTGTGIPSNARILSVNSPTSITLTANATTTAASNSLSFRGGTSLVKSGPGTLVLSNAANTFLGPLVLNDGVVSIGAARTLGPSGTTTSNSVYFNGGTYRAVGTYSPGDGTAPFIFGPAGGTIDVSVPNTTFTRQGSTLFGSGTLNKTGPGTLSIGSNSSAFNGHLVISGGTVRFQSNQFTNAIGGTVNPGGQYEINDDAAAGTFRFSTIAVMNLFGAGPAGSATPGAFILTDQSPNGAVPGGPGTTFSSAVQLTGDATVGVYNGNGGRISTLNFTNQVGGSGNLLKTGSGVLVLHSAANNYTGNTIVSNGTLKINGANRLPVATTLQFGETGSTNAGTFDLNGNSQAVGGLLSVGSSTAHQVINSAAATTPTFTVSHSGATPQIYAGLIGGAGGTGASLNFVKAGTGTLTLAGNSTYTGSTTVSSGILRVVTNGVNRPYTIADGASLVVVNTAPASAFAMSSLTLGAAGTTSLGFELQGTATTLGVINVSDAGGLIANGSVNVSINSAVTLGVGQFPLIKYNGTLGGAGFGALTAGALTLPSRVSGTLVNNTVNSSIDLNVTGVDFIKWTGSVAGGIWNLNQDQNWKLASNSAATTYLENSVPGDTVVFDESAAGTRTVSLASALSPSAVTVSGPSDYTFTGPGHLAGATGLTKSGTSTLTVLTNNVNTGATTVSGGTLRVGNGGTTGSIGAGNLISDAAVILDRSDDLTMTNHISGAGTLTKNGAGTLALTGSFTLSGDTTINAGTLNLSGGTTGNLDGAGTLVKSGVGTLVFAGNAAHTGGTTVTGGILQVGNGGTAGTLSGNISLNGGTTLAFNRSDDSISSSPITGAGGLSKDGAGKIALTGAMSYTGNTTVAAGAIEFASNSDFVHAGKLNSTNPGVTLIKSGTGTLTFPNSNSFDGHIIINGGAIILDDAGLGGDFNLVDSITINPGARFIFGATAGGNPDMPEGDTGTLITINGGEFEHRIGENWGTTRLTNNGTFRFNGFGGGVGSTSNATSGTYFGYALESGTIIAENVGSGTGSLNGIVNKTTSGTVSVQGRVSIADASTITISQGALAFEAINVPATGAGLITLGSAGNTGTFRMTGTGSASSVRPFDIVGSAEIDVASSSGALTLAGSITGDGTLTKLGAGSLNIPVAAPTFTGPTTVQAGTLRVGPGALGGSVTVNNAASLAVASGAGTSSLTIPTLALGATGSNLNFELNTATNPTTPLLVIGNNNGLTLGAATHVINVSNPQPLGVGQFVLIDYAGDPIASGFSKGSIGARVAGDLVYDTVNTTIALNITGIDSTLWTGSISGDWDAGTDVNVGGTHNFKLASNSAATNFITGDRVTFDDSATGATTVNLTTTLQPAALTVNNDTKTYTFQGTGSIGGSVALTKQGLGTLIVTTDNIYTGGTTISGGTLQLGNGGTTGSLTGNVSVAAGATLAVNRSNDWSYAGNLSGTGALNKSGAGILTLSGESQAFAGTLNVNQGTVHLDNAADLNATSIIINSGATFIFGENGDVNFPDSTIVTVNTGGTYDHRQGENFGGFILKGGTVVMSGAARTGVNITAAAVSGYTAESGTITTNFTGSANGGVLSGNTFFNKTTSGTVTLGGTVTFNTGISFNIKEGVLEMGTANFPVAGATSITMGDAATAGTLRVTDLGSVSTVRPVDIAAGGGTFDIANAATTVSLTAAVTGSGTLTKSGAGVLALTAANTYIGATTVTVGTLRVDGSVATSTGVTVAIGATFVAGATQVVKTLDLSAATSNASILAGAIRVLSVGDNTAASPLTLTGGKMDLNTSALVVDFSAGNEATNLAAMKTAIISGRGTGVWDGASGLTSTAAATTASVYGVGYAPSSIATGAIAGVTPDASSVVARYTRLGDANLDGAVNFFDLTALAAAYGAAGEWYNGDFDYSGTVNFFDLTALASNYGTGLPSEAIPGATPEFNADLAAAFASVPEPGAISLLGLAALTLLKRRNNRTAAW